VAHRKVFETPDENGSRLSWPVSTVSRRKNSLVRQDEKIPFFLAVMLLKSTRLFIIIFIFLSMSETARILTRRQSELPARTVRSP
jgi:hypothetical protein